MELTISKYSQSLLNGSTCCHCVNLQRDGKYYSGIYNGLSYWGRVEDENGHLVIELSLDFNEEYNQHDNFYPSIFEDAGYEIV